MRFFFFESYFFFSHAMFQPLAYEYVLIVAPLAASGMLLSLPPVRSEVILSTAPIIVPPAKFSDKNGRRRLRNEAEKVCAERPPSQEAEVTLGKPVVRACRVRSLFRGCGSAISAGR